MADKRFLPRFHLINATSMGASVTSAATRIEYIDNIGYEVLWSAGTSPVGTITIQVSNDHDETDNGVVLTVGNWQDVGVVDSAGVAPTISGASGDHFISLNQLPWKWVRLVYNRTSGTATLDVWITGKGV
jgi:hypothetical protein